MATTDVQAGDPKPGETVLTQKAEDVKPGEAKPGEQKPGEQTPGETKPGEQTPGEEKPGDKKAGAKDSQGDKGGDKLGPDGTPIGESKVPEKYALKFPEKGPLSAADQGQYAERAKALGLTQEQAQKLVDAEVAGITANTTRFLSELKADPEIGGDKLEANVQFALKGRDLLFPPESAGAKVINAWFDRTGVGNHPELVRAFARLGRMLAEDTIHAGAGGGGGHKEPKSAAQTLYPGMAE
jgi:hypothetical protein